MGFDLHSIEAFFLILSGSFHLLHILNDKMLNKYYVCVGVHRVDICSGRRSQTKFPGGVIFSENNAIFCVTYVYFYVIYVILCIYALWLQISNCRKLHVFWYTLLSQKLSLQFFFFTNIKYICTISCKNLLAKSE